MRNVISGNTGVCVRVTGDSNDNRIQGNLIGTQADGSPGPGNQFSGVEVTANRNILGPLLDQRTGSNVIAYNALNGITVTGGSANVFISRNSIYNNGQLGIDLGNNGVTANDDDDGDSGPNQLQNYPVIRPRSGSATTSRSPAACGAHRAPRFTSSSSARPPRMRARLAKARSSLVRRR